MRLSMVSLFMILTTVFLSGCTKSSMASLEDRSGNFYSQHGVIENAFASATAYSATHMAAPVSSIASNDIGAAPLSQPRIVPKHTQQIAAVSSSRWQWPVQGEVTERFGKQASGTKNEGITIAANDGAPIRAAQAGEVAYVGHDVKGYGNMVIVRHAGGEMTSYAHAKDITVNKGEHVGAGDIIAHVGTTGGVKAPQLHFALHEGSSTIDPLTRLPNQLAAR